MTFKKLLLALMVIVLATDIAIFIDIPFLRQILGFLCFTIIPGLLVLYALKLNEINVLKKFVLSVGLSLVFLLFAGLLTNYLLPPIGYEEPLSTYPLVISLNVALAMLFPIAYWRNKGATSFTFAPKISWDMKGKSLSLLILPLLFPLLAVAGRNLADTGGDNRVIIGLFLSIPLYVILLVWQNKKASAATYPLAIAMISLSLLLARGLISNYLVGGDIYSEYHSFQLVSKNLQWSLFTAGESLTASLSVSLLPTMFKSILGIGPIYIYKVVFLILTSLVPVISYIIFEKYLGPLYGFLAAFFFIAQIPFMYSLSGGLRIGIALISFSLALMVLFDDSLGQINKSLLFMIFLLALVVEYYVLPVIFFLLTFFLWLVPEVSKGKFGAQTLSVGAGVLLPAAAIFVWWSQLTVYTFHSYVYFVQRIVTSLSASFIEELRAYDVIRLYTLSPYPSLLMQVPSIIQRASFVILGVGVGYIILMKEWRTRFWTFMIIMITGFILVTAEIALPWISFGYGASRLYIQLLVILAPAFIVGCQAISDGFYNIYSFSKSKISKLHFRYRRSPSSLLLPIIVIAVVSQFFSSSFLLHQLVGLPGREITDLKSNSYLAFYICDSEVSAARWLGANNTENQTVYMGNILQPGSEEIFEYTEYGLSMNFAIYGFSKEPFIEDSFIFLRHLNIVRGEVNSPDIPGGTAELAEFSQSLTNRNRVYSNGTSIILR